MPAERASVTHKFSIGGHEGYITVGMYEDNRPGENFHQDVQGRLHALGHHGRFGADHFAGACSTACRSKCLWTKLVNTRFEPSGITANPNIRFVFLGPRLHRALARWPVHLLRLSEAQRRASRCGAWSRCGPVGRGSHSSDDGSDAVLRRR